MIVKFAIYCSMLTVPIDNGTIIRRTALMTNTIQKGGKCESFERQENRRDSVFASASSRSRDR